MKNKYEQKEKCLLLLLFEMWTKFSLMHAIVHLTLILLRSQQFPSVYTIRYTCIFFMNAVGLRTTEQIGFLFDSIYHEEKLNSCKALRKMEWFFEFLFHFVSNAHNEWRPDTRKNPIYLNKSCTLNNVHPPIFSFFPFGNRTKGSKNNKNTTTTTQKTHRRE